MTKFGVSFVDSEARHRELVERIEEPLEYGDRRAPRIRDLLGMGLAAEDALDDAGLEFDSPEDREAYIAEAIRQRAEDENRHPSA